MSNDGRLPQIMLYTGINLGNVLYGVNLLLCLQTVHVLLSNKGARKRSNLFLALFSMVMLFLVTVWVAAQTTFGANFWLINPDFPGGFPAYWFANISVWYMQSGRVGTVFLQLMTDGLMIYRCRTIWNSNRVVIVPVILWLVNAAFGGVFWWVNSLPAEDPPISTQLDFTYWAVAVLLNMILTCMICYRVLQHGRNVRQHLGHEYATLYFSIATIVVESVLPYTLISIAFLGMLGVGGSASPAAFICVYVLMMSISSQMLILRVVGGRALDKDSFSRPAASTIMFRVRDDSGLGTQTNHDVEALENVYPLGRDKGAISEV